MEYVTDEDDIRDSLKALDKVKGWALEQMGDMRKPYERGAAEESGESPEEQSAEGPAGERAEERGEEMVMPFDSNPPPRDFGEKPKGAALDIEVITPASRSARPPPPKPDDTGMDEWTNTTIKKLDKFGKKLPRR